VAGRDQEGIGDRLRQAGGDEDGLVRLLGSDQVVEEVGEPVATADQLFFG
jgi:hypothetical protein